MINEQEYVKALSGGDSKAFELLFLRYHPKLVYFFAGFVHDEAVAEDMTQDVFFNLWSTRERLASVRSFSSYLYRMARNALYNYYDHSLVCEKFNANRFLLMQQPETPEEELFARNLQELILLKVSQMPPQRRQVFCMSRVDGLTNAEIAERLHIGKRTVENHLTAALADIRKILEIILFLFS